MTACGRHGLQSVALSVNTSYLIENQYEDLALPEKKKALEEVDNILLRD
jgi:hypothetical protein